MFLFALEIWLKTFAVEIMNLSKIVSQLSI